MNPIQLFSHELFGDIRIVDQDGEPWFVAKDVAGALGYARPRDAIRDHCKGGGEMALPSKGGDQITAIIPETDLYRLIMRSKLPSAELFQDWVVTEVLPTIRKTGKYQIPVAVAVALPDSDILAAVALAEGVNVAVSAMELIEIAKAAGPDLLWPDSVVNVRSEAAALMRVALKKRESVAISQVAGVVCSKFFKSKWPELVDFLLFLNENHNGRWIRAAELIHIARENNYLKSVWADDCTRWASYARLGRLMGVYREARWSSPDGKTSYAIEVRKRRRSHEWRLVAKSSIKTIKA